MSTVEQMEPANRSFPFIPVGRTMLHHLSIWGMLVVSFLGSEVSAQEWAEKMFNKLEHDFGTVARGSDTVYRFEITNIYKQTMHITGVRSSCGCTSPTIENEVIETYEKAYVVARFNTRTFTGRRGATLTVTFGSPYSAEVQLRVHGNIRGDVVFQPGAVDFGSVDQGEIREQLVKVTYAGRDNWKIVDVTNDNDNYEVELEETTRQSGRVSYNLLVRLKDDVPSGFIKDQLTVVTNDSRADSQRFPLYVGGRVVPEISVTPESLVLGSVPVGEEITRKVVVRGKNPFRIVDVNCGDDCFSFSIDDESKEVHLVGITFRPGERPGAVKVPIEISTDRGPNRGATLVVSAEVVEPSPAGETQAEGQGRSQQETVDMQVAGNASK